MSARATPPAEFDEHALEAARRIASVDRARLKGGDEQFKAFVQVTIVDAMLFASAYAREPHVTVKGNSIVMSPAMPLSDHEMDVLRAIASRLKSNTAGGGQTPTLGLVISSTEDGIADKPAPGKRETALGQSC